MYNICICIGCLSAVCSGVKQIMCEIYIVASMTAHTGILRVPCNISMDAFNHKYKLITKLPVHAHILTRTVLFILL
jgi:hypothetical protein